MKDPLRSFVTSPVGQGPLVDAQGSVEGDNPVCGDKLRFFSRREEDGSITLAFLATACPATIAVASCAVRVYSGRAAPSCPPFTALREEIQTLGGLSSYEGHALSLVEEVLERLFRCEGEGG